MFSLDWKTSEEVRVPPLSPTIASPNFQQIQEPEKSYMILLGFDGAAGKLIALEPEDPEGVELERTAEPDAALP